MKTSDGGWDYAVGAKALGLVQTYLLQPSSVEGDLLRCIRISGVGQVGVRAVVVLAKIKFAEG